MGAGWRNRQRHRGFAAAKTITNSDHRPSSSTTRLPRRIGLPNAVFHAVEHQFNAHQYAYILLVAMHITPHTNRMLPLAVVTPTGWIRRFMGESMAAASSEKLL
jgi:hypothetical protein